MKGMYMQVARTSLKREVILGEAISLITAPS
jgi:hypothetical protein